MLSLSGFSTFIFISLISTITKISAVRNDTEAVLFLSRYGYLSAENGQSITEISISNAVKEFQAFVGINITGNLDDETLQMMSRPRCGNNDKMGISRRDRRKRFVLTGRLWKKKDLTYEILNYTDQLSRSQIDQAFERAFGVWSEVTPLRFRRVFNGAADISIKFKKLDGPKNRLAFAEWFSSGDILVGAKVLFDDSEKWTLDVGSGVDLFQIAVHEFGHALGLNHSEVKKAVMYSIYHYSPHFSLDQDDIEGIQALYRANQNSKTTAEPPISSTPKSNSDPKLCNNGSIDTIFNSKENVTYIFKGQYYWELNDISVEADYPKIISENWIGLPGNIDAAFTGKKNKTYFFKGSKYWRYDGTNMDGNYPMNIKNGFPGIPNEVQGATFLSVNEKVYFFKGEKYWEYDPKQQSVNSTFPKAISDLQGVPNDVDDIFQSTSGNVYFFKKSEYYKFNLTTQAVEIARNISRWFGCEAPSMK